MRHSNTKYRLAELLDIEYPIIMAPMFLVSNTKMVIEALNNGITGAIPALNYRTINELKSAIREIQDNSDKAFGINLIVNKSNLKYKAQLQACIEQKIPYIITSLGNPKEVIEKCKPIGIKVFCDVVDLKYAKKVEDLGADAVIAVNNQAGGHCGPKSQKELITELKNNLSIPVISAGGISDNKTYIQALMDGADGVSVGTIFIASKESGVSNEYKQALIDYSAKDIVLTNKLSGSHLTVINTPYMQEIGNKASWFVKLLKNKRLKKYIKLIIAYRGMKAIENAANKVTYKTVWCAGPSIENIHSIQPIKEIIKSLTEEV